MERKAIFTLIAILSLLLILTSCIKKVDKNSEKNNSNSNSGGNKKVEIIFSSNRTDFQDKELPELARQFKEKHPDVDVKIEAVKDYQATIKVKMSSNNLPDVWTIHGGEYSQDVMQKYNVNISKEMPELANDFIETEPFKGADGNLYGLPTGVTYDLCIYNKKLFKELGIEVPKTLTEFVDAGKKISSSGKIGLLTAAGDQWPLKWYFGVIPKLLSGDPDVLNKLAEEDHPFVPEKPVYKSFQILKTFRDEGIIEPDANSAKWETVKKEFRSGNVGMAILGTWFIPQVVGEALTINDIGVFPFPYDDDASVPRNINRGPDVGLGISKNSKNLDAAKEFFKYMMDEKYIDYAKLCGLASARKSMSVDFDWVKELSEYKPNVIPNTEMNQKYKTIKDDIQFGDGEKVSQDIISGKSLDEIFNDLNQKWEKAKSKVK